MSSQDEDGLRPDYPPWSGEPAASDILEQGSDRPPTRWRLAVRWRRPPLVAIILGVVGLLGGLVAGYAAGTLHAESVAATSAQSGVTAAPTGISQVVIGDAPSQFRLLCPGQPGATGGHLRVAAPLRVATPGTSASPAPTAHGKVFMNVPSVGWIELVCHQ